MDLGHIVLGLFALIFLILWMIALAGGFRASTDLIRELQIALRFIATYHTYKAEAFAHLFLSQNFEAIRKHFPDFARFRKAIIEQEGDEA